MPTVEATQNSDITAKVDTSKPTVSIKNGFLEVGATVGREKMCRVTLRMSAREIAALWPELLQSALDVKPLDLTIKGPTA